MKEVHKFEKAFGPVASFSGYVIIDSVNNSERELEGLSGKLGLTIMKRK